MTIFTETQRTIIEAALGTNEGVVPVDPAAIGVSDGSFKSAIKALASRALISPARGKAGWRLSTKGRKAIVTGTPSAIPKDDTLVKTLSKKQQLVELLSGGTPVALPTLCQTFGWQAHSVRAAISGLRKAGYVVERELVEGQSAYRITQTPGVDEGMAPEPSGGSDDDPLSVETE